MGKHVTATMPVVTEHGASLDGFCVGITADRRWADQAALFERRGASVVHAPTIRTLPLGGDERLRRSTERLIAEPPRFVLANTGIGMRAWFAAAESWGLGDALRGALEHATIYARGPKASAAVHAVDLDVAARARTERLREVTERVAADLRPGDRVALQRDGGPPPPEAELLRRAGADVVEVPVYEWRMPDDVRPALRLAEAVIAGRVHAVTFTAGPQVRNWIAIAAEHDLDSALVAALASCVVGCVGPVCAEAARSAGLPDDALVVPAAARLGPLVRAVAEQLAHRATRIDVGDTSLHLSGTVVRVGTTRVELSEIEARLLAALAERPGAVVGKPELLRAVWNDPDGDPHTVEVAVNRLRRRLGEHAGVVAAVPRRGYRLA